MSHILKYLLIQLAYFTKIILQCQMVDKKIRLL